MARPGLQSESGRSARYFTFIFGSSGLCVWRAPRQVARPGHDCAAGRVAGHVSSFPVLSSPPTINLAHSEVKDGLLYLEAGCGLLGPQSEVAPLDDRAGELQLGGGLPTDHFLHGVSADQPNHLHRPAPRRRREACDRGRRARAHACGERAPDAVCGRRHGAPWTPRSSERPGLARVLTQPSRASREGRRGGRHWAPSSAAQGNLCLV